MKYDGQIDLAVGMGAKSRIWKNEKTTWSGLVNRLSEENKTSETYKDFLIAGKEDQLKIKDVGGYVGGYLRAGRRKPENIVHRQLLTLDIDFAHIDFWEDYCLQFENAAVLHGTHKHHENSPRYRLIIPLSRETTPDEYVAIARKLAGVLGIDSFDNTTFETNRLMFWPSTPKDIDYYFEFQDGPWVDADEILDSYVNWKDSSLWPTAEKAFDGVKQTVKKQEDPENKRGVIGAFCRTYSITESIEKFLEGVYVKADMEDRYTYAKGTAAAGLIVYDDKFAYSHHGTDPCGSKLCNSFDLVRIHKFGHLDEGRVPGVKPKSFKEMDELVKKDKGVKKTIAVESIQEAKYDFADIDVEAVEDENIEWMQELEVDNKGAYPSNAVNITLIFKNDFRLKNLFRQNNFDNKKYVFGTLPWRKIPSPEPIRNVDLAGVRNYIESIYGISGNLKVEDAMTLEFEKNHFHPVRDYLLSVEWDKVKRVDTLLIDYFGSDDNVYIREAIRKMLVGAVSRIFNPGIKFDLVLTLVGPQGTGKSTFVNKLGQKWFSDSFQTVHGKEAFEQLQGAWLIEMAELSGLRKAEVEAVKHFISKQEDTFRPAYARASETYPRQCVFVGTTNNKDFLRDPSGNRRFMPISISKPLATKNIFKDLDGEVDQIWAEAVHYYRNKEPLFLSTPSEKIAYREQRKHSESDERVGIIDNYINTLLPEDWSKRDMYERRTFVEDPLAEKGTIERDYVCVAEVWCECLGKNKEDMDRYKTRDINEILKSLEEWEFCNTTKTFELYGTQRFYQRKLD